MTGSSDGGSRRRGQVAGGQRDREGGDDLDEALEANEADWLDNRRDRDGSFASEGLPIVDDPLVEADAADLHDSLGEPVAPDLPSVLPLEAPEADVIEQHQLPGDNERGEEDWS